METKRCQRCHKLLRAEAQTCSRCGGYDFLPVSQAKPRHTGVLLSDETTSTPPHATRSVGSPLSPLPPVPTQLSPHRAGHYSGLHPEDEPYQSSFLPVQRLPLSEQPALDIEEVEDLAYSTVPDMPGTPAPAPVPAPIAAPQQKRRVASLTPLPPPRQQRSAQTLRAPAPPHEIERGLESARAYAEAPTIAAPRPRRPERREMNLVVRLLLIIAAFLFIVATGILAFLLIDSKPTVALKPVLTADVVEHLRVSDTLLLYGSRFEANATVRITRDANIAVLDTHGKPLQTPTYSTGNFVVPVTIGQDWSARPHTIYATDQQGHEASLRISVEGPSTNAPLLQVSLTSIDFGEKNAGVVEHKDIMLINAGGGKVIWQGSSDSPWLKLTPSGSSFAGSEDVVITVDRSNLSPGPYTGHITFTQQGSTASPLRLTVKMGVNPASANLVISNAALTFNGNPVTNPAAQTLTIQNTGGQSLNWTASVSTNGSNWLSLSSSSGYLPGGTSQAMTVFATSTGLSAGTYQGTITLSYGGVMATPVAVTLVVNPPPVAKIAISQGGLSFHAIMGQNPLAQRFTITNSGNAPLNWGILEDATAKTYTPVSQASGTLAPGKGIVITVTPSIGQAGAGTLNATITVFDTDKGTAVAPQAVKVTVTIVNQAVITLDQSQMTFNHSVSQQINISTQMLTVTNTGSAPLNWSLSISNPSPIAWLSVDTTSGSNVQPGGAAFITVSCDSTNLSPGTFQAVLTLQDTDAGTPVASQTMTVTVIVSP